MSKNIIFELVIKIATFLALLYFSYMAIYAYENSKNTTILFMLISEFITLGLVVISKFTSTRDFSLLSFITTICATFYFYIVSLDHNKSLLPEFYCNVIIVAGIVFQIYAKISLGRSFGLLPADRGIVTRGAYKIVRHPIYLGYFISHMGFLLGNFSGYNLLVYIYLYFFQICRIYFEERILINSTAYKEYKSKVKYRMFPFIF